MSVTVIDVGSEDPRIAELAATQEAELGALYGIPADATLDDFALERAAALILLEVEGVAAGCGALRSVDPRELAFEARAPFEIKRLRVAEYFRGRGLSRVLMEALEKRGQRLGCDWLVLETGLKQPAAVKLYRSLGYESIPGYGHFKDDAESIFLGKRFPRDRATESSIPGQRA